MLINIEDIKIKKRVRKNLGDLEALKNSLRIYGLLNPITLNSKYELIAGERRLQAAKHPKIKSDTVSTVSPSICHEVMRPDAMIFVF